MDRPSSSTEYVQQQQRTVTTTVFDPDHVNPDEIIVMSGKPQQQVAGNGGVHALSASRDGRSPPAVHGHKQQQQHMQQQQQQPSSPQTPLSTVIPFRYADESNAGRDGAGSGCEGILLALSWFLVLLTLPISIFGIIKTVQEYERAVIFRLGRLLKGGARGPGVFFINPFVDKFRKVDLRIISFNVPPQEILTKDSVTVAVDAVVYYRVRNATIAVVNVENADASTRLLAATTIRNVLGMKTLAEILAEREHIAQMTKETLDEATENWGISVERVEMKDVRLPVSMQRAMAAEAEASREARAKVIAAEGEQKASRALKEAADTLSESPAALQLRYLQTLNTIAAEKNSTIVFPLPIDILAGFLPSRR